MTAALRRRVTRLLRFLTPSPATGRYVRQIRQSGEFDRGYYLASNPRLRLLFRWAPERHYALFGEAMGLCPNPGFSPRAYRHNNPDLDQDGRPPLQHYIERGRAERRTVLATDAPVPALPAITTADLPTDPAPVAVMLHLYYTEMWPEFAAQLQAQSFAFDLYVTLTGSPEQTAPLRRQILQAFPAARVWALPNHGRDIFPFLMLINAGLAAPYRAVCKLHSKKSPHREDGEDWRQRLCAGVLGNPGRTAARLQRFLDDPETGIWVAGGQHHRGAEWWGMNRNRTLKLLRRAGIPAAPEALDFPAGSIYWAKPAVLEQLARLQLGAADFEPEQALVDGTTAHAVERAMGYLAAAAGLKIREAPELDTTGQTSRSSA